MLLTLLLLLSPQSAAGASSHFLMCSHSTWPPWWFTSNLPGKLMCTMVRESLHSCCCFLELNCDSPSPSLSPAAFKLRCDIGRALRTDRSWLWFTFCQLSSNQCNNLIDHLSLIGITLSFMLQSMLAMLQSPLTLLFFFLFSPPSLFSPSFLSPSLPLSLSPYPWWFCSTALPPSRLLFIDCWV